MSVPDLEALNVAAMAVAAMVTVAALMAASFIALMREHGIHIMRKVAALRRRPLVEIALIAAMVGGFVQHGATKTNGVERCGNITGGTGVSPVQGGLEARSSGGVRFTEITPMTNGVALAIELPTGGVTGDALDLFCSFALTNTWSLLGEATVAPSTATANVFVAVSDFPASPTNMPQSAFFAAATHDDADCDGLYDGRERLVHGTDPLRPDTDGDGLSDGAEVTASTDPLCRDTDGDGFPDDEEIAASMNPLVADPGASATIRYAYDDDDRLTAAYVGADGGASLTTWSPAGDPNSVTERKTSATSN